MCEVEYKVLKETEAVSLSFVNLVEKKKNRKIIPIVIKKLFRKKKSLSKKIFKTKNKEKLTKI